MNEAAIEFKGFTFQYREQSEPTLYNIDLRIEKGEKVMIAGPSGSGKSTIGHCINGLIPHYYKGNISGKLYVGGEDTAKMNIFALSKHVGTVLQDSDGQFVGLTVGEDIAFALENDMMAQSEMKERVAEVARTVAIDSHLKAHPQELSGGQKQRVSLAGVMVDDVNIFLFDEPLANLDPATGKNAIELIDEIHERTDAAIIVIEHRLEDVLWRKMDRIILMEEGRIIRDDTPDNILASGILRTSGIREPLYVTALSYAGIRITPEIHPESLNAMGYAPGLGAFDQSRAGNSARRRDPFLFACELRIFGRVPDDPQGYQLQHPPGRDDRDRWQKRGREKHTLQAGLRIHQTKQREDTAER